MGQKVNKNHGAAEHTDITRELFIPACEGFVLAGTPVESSVYGTVEGAADLDEPDVYFTIKVPDDFVSFSSVKAVWRSWAAAGNMYWRIYAYYAACGEALNTHMDTPLIGTTADGGASIINCQEPANALTLANLVVGDFVGLNFKREGSNALDTLDNSMFLFGLLFTYVANQ